MAEGSQILTTYYAKRIMGDTAAATATRALLQTGENIVTDTWILHRSDRNTQLYGIKYKYGDTVNTVNDGHDKIEFYGASTAIELNATPSAWIQLDTGDTYFMGNVGIGTDTLSYKLSVNGTSYFSDVVNIANHSIGSTQGSGSLIIGSTGGKNISIDEDEIIARDYASNAVVASNLKLNVETASTTGHLSTITMGNSGDNSGYVSIQYTNDCTSTSTGALRVSGGLYVTKQIRTSDDLTIYTQFKRASVTGLSADTTRKIDFISSDDKIFARLAAEKIYTASELEVQNLNKVYISIYNSNDTDTEKAFTLNAPPSNAINTNAYISWTDHYVGHEILPYIHDSYNIGDANYRWKYGYFTTDLFIGATTYTNSSQGVVGTSIGAGSITLVGDTTPEINFKYDKSTSVTSYIKGIDGAVKIGPKLVVNSDDTTFTLNGRTAASSFTAAVYGNLFATNPIYSNTGFYVYRNSSGGGGVRIYQGDGADSQQQYGALYIDTLGATNAEGSTILLLGNDKKYIGDTKQDKNASGLMRLYNCNGGYGYFSGKYGTLSGSARSYIQTDYISSSTIFVRIGRLRTTAPDSSESGNSIIFVDNKTGNDGLAAAESIGVITAFINSSSNHGLRLRVYNDASTGTQKSFSFINPSSTNGSITNKNGYIEWDNGYINNSIYPYTDGDQNIGSFAYRWLNVRLAGAVSYQTKTLTKGTQANASNSTYIDTFYSYEKEGTAEKNRIVDEFTEITKGNTVYHYIRTYSWKANSTERAYLRLGATNAESPTYELYTNGNILAQWSIYAGTTSESVQRVISVRSNSGALTLYSSGNENSNGGRGLWVDKKGDDGLAFSIISADTNSNITFNLYNSTVKKTTSVVADSSTPSGVTAGNRTWTIPMAAGNRTFVGVRTSDDYPFNTNGIFYAGGTTYACSAVHSQILEQYLISSNRNSTSVDVRANGLLIYGTCYGNDAAPLLSNTDGLIRFGDGGPQIIFASGASPFAASPSQAGALIFTDHNDAGGGASFHFVTNQSADNQGGNLVVTAPKIWARKSIKITNGEAADHLEFSRSTYNYISIPATNGAELCIGAVGSTINNSIARFSYNSTANSRTTSLNGELYTTSNIHSGGHIYLAASKHIYMNYTPSEGSATDYPILYNHANGNVSLRAATGGIHIGWLNTNETHMYTSNASTRTEWFTINSNGSYAQTRFGVNGQNTSYNFYVNGSSYLNGNTYSHNIYASSSGTTGSTVQVSNDNGKVELLASTNRGLYDRTKDDWIIYTTKAADHTYVKLWASTGSTLTPVYFNSSGEPVACSGYFTQGGTNSAQLGGFSFPVSATTHSNTQSYASHRITCQTTTDGLFVWDNTDSDTVWSWRKQTVNGSVVWKADAATTDASGNTITTYYCTLSTAQTLSGNKTFSGRVILTKDTDASGTAANAVALVVGGAQTAQHIEIDSNEILSKSDGTTPSTLYLQDSTGGTVSVAGSGGLAVTATTASSSKTTGALRVSGGAGFSGTVYANAFNGPLTGNVTGNATTATTAKAVSDQSTADCSTSNNGGTEVAKNLVWYGEKNGNGTMRIRHTQATDGTTKLELVARNYNSSASTPDWGGWRGITIIANKDNTATYSVTSPANFRTAISAKGTQTAVNDPSASGTGITYIATISQNTQGVISVTKSTVRSASAEQSGIVTTGAQTFAGVKTFNSKITGSITGNCDGNAATASALKNAYTSRPTNANIAHVNDGGVQYFKSTSSMTSNSPGCDGSILHFHWDTSAAWDSQLHIPDSSNQSMHWRGSSAAGTWGSWYTILDSNNYTSYTVTKTGGGASGSWGISITGNSATATTASQVSYQNSTLDITSGTYGLSDDWGRDMCWFGEKAGNGIARLRVGVTKSNGKASLYLTVRAANGSAVGSYGGFTITGNRDNTFSYSVSSPANFRSAISAPSTTGSGASGKWNIIAAQADVVRYSGTYDALKADNGGTTAYPTPFYVYDKNDKVVGYCQQTINSNGNISITLGARNWKTDGTEAGTNRINLTINKSGTCSYSVSNAAAFRSAISAAASDHTHNYAGSSSAGGDATRATLAGGVSVASGVADVYSAGTGSRLRTQSYQLILQNSDGNLIMRNSAGTSNYWNISRSGALSSSYKVKNNIRRISDGDISRFMFLNPISFVYKPELHMADTSLRYGLIAEEVACIYPNLVDIPDDYDPSQFDINKGINQPIPGIKYDQFIPLLIKMVQNQQKEIEQLRNQINKRD